MHDDARLTNLLGASALSLTDLLLTAATAPAGLSTSAAAALVALRHSPGLSVTDLGRRVGLTQPAAARMVDGLEHRRLVERRAGAGRSVAMHLTRHGRRAATTVLTGRSRALDELVSGLAQQDKKAMELLLNKLLALLEGQAGGVDRVCRLCDRGVCIAGGAVCPVGQAARDRGADDG